MKCFSPQSTRRRGLRPPGLYEYFIVSKKIPFTGPKSLRAFIGVLKKAHMINVVKNIRNYYELIEPNPGYAKNVVRSIAILVISWIFIQIVHPLYICKRNQQAAMDK